MNPLFRKLLFFFLLFKHYLYVGYDFYLTELNKASTTLPLLKTQTLYKYLIYSPNFSIQRTFSKSYFFSVHGSYSCSSPCSHWTPGKDLSLKWFSRSNYNPKRQLLPRKSKTTWQRKRINGHCHMFWILNFFLFRSILTSLSNFPFSDLKKLRDAKI